MDNIFYCAAILFILEAIRGSFMAKKEILEYKAGVNIPDKTSMQDPDKLKDTMNSLLADLKTKAIPAIVGLFMLIWNVIGIFYTKESTWFIVNIGVLFTSTILAGYNQKFRTEQLIVTFNILSITIMSYILYLHFA